MAENDRRAQLHQSAHRLRERLREQKRAALELNAALELMETAIERWAISVTGDDPFSVVVAARNLLGAKSAAAEKALRTLEDDLHTLTTAVNNLEGDANG